MPKWTDDELNKVGAAEELEIAPAREDGTLRKPTTIWVVRVGDDLYVRSYKGRGGSWFRGAQASHEGRVRAGGVQKDVKFEDETDSRTNGQIDTAYRTKYSGYSGSYVEPMVAPGARATTMKLVPR